IPASAWENSPAIGDELGVFTVSGTLIGAGIFNGENMAVTVWGNDEFSSSIDGMIPGEQFTLELWSQNTNQISVIDVVWEKGTNVYESNEIVVAGKVSQSLMPLSFVLEQNIPNPFMQFTQIGFEIPEDAYISISIYNLLGEKLQDVVAGNYLAGHYTVDFDATGLAAGTYLYRIVSDNFVATKNMVVK
ncbi:MAG: T9SS type A sorting domain-containing protein, partial [Bacteroidota bacterium]|nr:T9SS type A sorting domain-containing protein [Bacteroidota bacterium]